MVLTTIEILATIFAGGILLKLLFGIFGPKCWMKISKGVLKQNTLMTIIYLGLAVLIGYYVLSSLTIVEVAAVMLFITALMALAWLPYTKILFRARKEVTKDVFRKSWLSIIIWLAIAIWVLLTVFCC